MNNKPYITLEEALAARQEGKRGVKFLTEANGCLSGCCSGVTIYSEKEFNPAPGIMMIRKVFLFLKEKDMQSLEIPSFL